jgi:hypothetical protein
MTVPLLVKPFALILGQIAGGALNKGVDDPRGPRFQLIRKKSRKNRAKNRD